MCNYRQQACEIINIVATLGNAHFLAGGAATVDGQVVRSTYASKEN